ncbi:MAG: 50S ribosomal protein L18 [Candidatus Ryanbacteria bacterium]|nr:50S ribosomal protein L18 [Candidatus Ryanbacteria bacterium]
MKSTTHTKRITRHKRVRARIHGTSTRPRLSVFRSNKHLHAQLIDDAAGKTLLGMSDAALKTKGAKSSRADLLGGAVAKKAQEKGITKVVFDRGGFRYHGRVKTFADAVRKGGIQF